MHVYRLARATPRQEQLGNQIIGPKSRIAPVRPASTPAPRLA
jgi:hypothetical protein